MNVFDYKDKIRFTKAVFYNFRPIPLPRPFQDGTGGFGQNVPEQGYLELSDDTGMTAHYTVTRAFVREMLPKLLNGESRSYNDWRETLYWQARNAGFQSGQAVNVGVVDLLMLDLLSQRAGKALHRFLGAEKDWAAAYKGGGSILLSDAELVEEMCRYVSEGFTTVKFKVGSDKGRNMERDLRRIEKVREAVGEKIGIAVDANQRWSVEDAVKFARLAEPYRLVWFEEPIHSADFNGIRRMKELGVKQKLAAGESMRISYMYEIYLEKGLDIVQPSLGRMTRIDDLLKIRDMARAAGKGFQSGGRTAYNATFGCLYGAEEPIEFHAPISEPVQALMRNLPEFRDGRCFVRSDIPGIPIRMDLEKLEKLGYLESRTIYLPPRA